MKCKGPADLQQENHILASQARGTKKQSCSSPSGQVLKGFI